MKGKALRKHSLHEKTAASVLLKLFIHNPQTLKECLILQNIRFVKIQQMVKRLFANICLKRSLKRQSYSSQDIFSSSLFKNVGQLKKLKSTQL